jgi:hypothetical protein
MRRAIAALTVVIALYAASVLALADITFVLKSGERIRGTGVTRSQSTITVSVNGQERGVPMNEVAVVLYNDGEPTAGELAQLPSSENPPTLERDLLVMRDGRVIRGAADDFNPERLVFDTAAGRQFFSAGEIARLYMNGPAARQVFGSRVGTTGSTAGGRRRGEAADATVKVEGVTPWTDTGIVVRAGERIAFEASGTINILPDATAGPDGQTNVRQGTYPLRGMAAGGLIGRVGNSRPFAIGSTRRAIDMPAGGRLFLGVNDDNFSDNGGSFEVQIFRR